MKLKYLTEDTMPKFWEWLKAGWPDDVRIVKYIGDAIKNIFKEFKVEEEAGHSRTGAYDVNWKVESHTGENIHPDPKDDWEDVFELDYATITIALDKNCYDNIATLTVYFYLPGDETSEIEFYSDEPENTLVSFMNTLRELKKEHFLV